MALTKGTNCGFVNATPTGDPNGTGGSHSGYAIGFKDVSSAGVDTVSELGFYCGANNNLGPDWEACIYSHDAGNDRPNAIVGDKAGPEALSNDAGWKTFSGLSISISASTTYWAATQVDSGASVSIDYAVDAGELYKYAAAATLPDPWTSDLGFARLIAIYAVETSTGGNAPTGVLYGPLVGCLGGPL